MEAVAEEDEDGGRSQVPRNRPDSARRRVTHEKQFISVTTTSSVTLDPCF